MSHLGTGSENWDTTRSYGNVPIVQTHETLNEGTTFFHTRFWCAAFLIPNGLTAVVFPVFPHNKETFSHISHRAKVRKMGPHTHQGPHVTGFTRSVKMDFDMEWFGLMYSIDASVMLTSSADFIRGQQMQLLASAVNLTLTHKIVESIMNLPDIYALYRSMLTTGVQQRYSPETIDQLVMDLKERTPGFINGQGCPLQAIDRNSDMYHSLAPTIASFLMFADELLHAMKVDESMVPNFFMVGASTARGLNVTRTAELLPSFASSRAIAAHLNRENKTEDLSLAAIKAVMLGQLTHNISLIPIDPIREDTGTVNLLSRTFTTGLMYPVRIRYSTFFPHITDNRWIQSDTFGCFRPDVIVSIPDFERRQNVDVRFQHPLTIKQIYPDENAWYNGADMFAPDRVKGVVQRAASTYIAHALRAFVERHNLPDSVSCHRLQILMFSAQNRFAGTYTNNMHDAAIQDYMFKFDSMNTIALAHYRMFYHTLNVNSSEFPGPIFEIPTETHEFTRIRSVDEFRNRYTKFFKLAACKINPDFHKVRSTDTRISQNELIHNTYVYSTIVTIPDRTFRNFDHRNFYAVGTIHEIEAVLNNYEDRRLSPLNVVWGNTNDPATFAGISSRTGFLNISHANNADPINAATTNQTLGSMFNCAASAFQFMLDVLFITDVNNNDRTYVFPPSVEVSLTLDGNENKFTVPALPNYEIIDIVQAKIVITTEAIVYGIGGEDTGVVALGQQKVTRFTVPEEQHEETHMLIRAAVAIKEPNHLVVVPDAAYRGYISGASSRLYGPKFFTKDYATTFTDRGSAGLRRPARSNKPTEADMVAIVAPAFTAKVSKATIKLNKLSHEITSTSGRNDRLVGTEFSPLVASDIKHWREFNSINSPMTEDKLYLPYGVIIETRDLQLPNTCRYSVLFGNRMSLISEHRINDTDIIITPISVPKTPVLDIWRHMPHESSADTYVIKNMPIFRNDDITERIESNQSETARDNVSRGPLRYITHESGMDTFCGRACAPTSRHVIVKS